VVYVVPGIKQYMRFGRFEHTNYCEESLFLTRFCGGSTLIRAHFNDVVRMSFVEIVEFFTTFFSVGVMSENR